MCRVHRGAFVCTGYERAISRLKAGRLRTLATVCKGLDICTHMRLRGEGDSVMIPPSIRNGICYVYSQPDIAVAAMPEALIELVCGEPTENTIYAA